MAYSPSHDLPGGQPITETSTVQRHPLGTRIRAVDPVYGESEFIYLKGVASTVVGSAVVYDQKNGTTVLTLSTSRGPVAVSMSANVANQFGWYAVAGCVPVKAQGTIVSGNRPVADSTTPGAFISTAAANLMVIGARFVSADSGGLADVQLGYPSIGDSNL